MIKKQIEFLRRKQDDLIEEYNKKEGKEREKIGEELKRVNRILINNT